MCWTLLDVNDNNVNKTRTLLQTNKQNTNRTNNIHVDNFYVMKVKYITDNVQDESVI